MRITASEMDAGSYAPYGALVRAGDAASGRDANYGTATAWDALAVLENRRGERARASASVFRSRPYEGRSMPLLRLERHADSTQLFVPMSASRYLVVVALGDDAPDLATLRAFIVPGGSGIAYAPGTWHHPMVALDTQADFVNVVFVDGTPRDCEEVSLAASQIEIVLGE